jgi:anaphase-promoting complex subunit 2
MKSVVETWSVEELSNVLQMPATALRRKIAYWQTQGILREEATDKFVLVEEHKGRSHDIIVADDDEAESAMASSQAQREEELQVLPGYYNTHSEHSMDLEHNVSMWL